MLKWAVNGTRQSYLKNGNNNMEHPASSRFLHQRKRLKRKSYSFTTRKPLTSCIDKENQYTSTPLQTCKKKMESSSNKMESLKNLSRIVHGLACDTPFKLSPNTVQSETLKTPEITETHVTVPKNYASTLPTFDVEYSPCACIHGPMLALRGVGVPDSYFGKPRYITPQLKEGLNDADEELSLETKTFQKPVDSILKYPAYMGEEPTLSSSKMGDVTLERMIDAILESNRKDRKSSKSKKNPQEQHYNISPTYTPAEDPASDLHEVWDSEKARYRQNEHKLRARLTKKRLCNDREICSSQFQENLDRRQLERQCGLRRKRKINKIRASVVSSAKKCLGKGVQSHSSNLSKVSQVELMHNEVYSHNLSPDSGHSSSSDYEEQETSSILPDDSKTLDNTKRRLNFSLQNLDDK